MPRLDNPNIKLKQLHSFKRQNLRPWDDPHNFIPSKILENIEGNTDNDLDMSSNHYAAITKTNSKQIVNNKETFVEPIVNDKENNEETISEHGVRNKKTDSKQLGNVLGNNNETNSKRIGKQLPPIKEHILSREEISYEESFKCTKLLVGLQKKALFYIVENCKMGGVLYTSPITNDFFKQLLNTDADSVKTTIQRLVNKGLLKRKEGKKGNGGYTVFSITEAVRNAVTEINRQMQVYNQLETNSRQIINELGNNKETDKETKSAVVSSSYFNTITTTNLPEDFKKIDCSPLTEIGFDESHIIQIHREYIQKPEITLSAEIVQNSINALAFDLKYNNIINDLKRPPAVFLTYLLKKGQPYSSKTPEKVLTPKEEAMKKYMLAQEQKNAKMLEIENKTQDFALQEWLNFLPEEELLSFNDDGNVRPHGMPEKLYQTSRRKKALMHAKEYFDTIIWPQKRKEIFNQE